MAQDLQTSGQPAEKEEITAALNHYQILGVEPGARYEEILRAYRVMIQRHHPDKGGDPEVYELITNAWKVLSNDRHRAVYDTAMEGDWHPEEILVRAEGILEDLIKRNILDEAQDAPEDEDPATIDWMGMLTEHINIKVQGFHESIKREKKKIKKIERLNGRFTVRKSSKRKKDQGDPRSNLFSETIEARLETLKSNLDEMKKGLLISRVILNMLVNYEFSAESAPSAEYGEVRFAWDRGSGDP